MFKAFPPFCGLSNEEQSHWLSFAFGKSYFKLRKQMDRNVSWLRYSRWLKSSG